MVINGHTIFQILKYLAVALTNWGGNQPQEVGLLWTLEIAFEVFLAVKNIPLLILITPLLISWVNLRILCYYEMCLFSVIFIRIQIILRCSIKNSVNKIYQIIARPTFDSLSGVEQTSWEKDCCWFWGFVQNE